MNCVYASSTNQTWLYVFFKEHSRTGKMAQWLRILVALAEDLDLIPRIHIVAHDYPKHHF